MIALLIGILFILFAVYSVIPNISWGLNWGPEVIAFLKGGVPVILVFVGLIAVLIGVADIKDRIEAKKEEESENSEESQES